MPGRINERQYFVYIMASWRNTLYIGMTSDLESRVAKHKSRSVHGVTAKYHAVRLVWYEATTDVHAALAREKQIKGWLRARKVELIATVNPEWNDLAGYLNRERDSEPPPSRSDRDSGGSE